MSNDKNTKTGAKASVPFGAKFEITVEGAHTIHLKKVDRATLRIAMTMIGAKDPDYVRAGEIILMKCVIPSENWDKIQADEDLMTAFCFQAITVIEIKDGEVKKL